MMGGQHQRAVIEALLQRARALCVDLGAVDLGYPLATNCVRPTLPADMRRSFLREVQLPEEGALGQFFGLCNGISLPDVHNGYSIDGLEVLRKSIQREANWIEDRAILVIGGDGGGGRFAVTRGGRGAPEYLFLPTGEVRDRVYLEPEKVIVLARTFHDFLSQIVVDLEHFVHDPTGHTFITDLWLKKDATRWRG
jgi:hypothetical protein